MWQKAYEADGYEWIDADNNTQSILTYVRHGKDKRDDLVILLNMDINAHENFRMGVPESGIYEEVFNTDDPRYGGSGVYNGGQLISEDVPWNGRKDSLVLRVPPLGGIILKRTADLPPKKKAPAKKAGAAIAKTGTKTIAKAEPAAKAATPAKTTKPAKASSKKK